MDGNSTLPSSTLTNNGFLGHQEGFNAAARERRGHIVQQQLISDVERRASFTILDHHIGAEQ
jgi:hypothetical protein